MERRPALLAIVCAIAALAAPGTAGARTRVHHFTPFDASGTLKNGYRVVHGAGNCPQPSNVDSRRHDAWRCTTGNLIRDPCFESPVSDEDLACVASPWSHKALIIRALLPTRQGESRSSAPWAIALAHHPRCLFLSGASKSIGRKRLNYSCGRNGPFLYGVPDRRTPTWTISLAAHYKSRTLRRVGVKNAWR
jgi:hypothetical protein